MAAHSTDFRNDIEGLRAWAIVPVVVFHAFPQSLPGGFLGVDVFFVISGYLITKLLAQRMDAGTYSLAGFYAARVKRIFPALFVTLFTATWLAWWLMPALELRSFGRTLQAAVVFLSNHEFLRTSDYFGGDAELKPLLHTWSLAVEEQFYLLFPPLLWLIKRQTKVPAVALVGLLGLVSLAYSQYWLARDASVAFYVATSRAFELVLGALCALAGPQVSARLSPNSRQVLGMTALIALVACFVVLTPESRLPGVLALWPCLAAGALIVTGMQDSTLSQRILCLSPLRWIGRLSFSLYLWHWIALVFLRVLLLREPSSWETAAAIVVAVGVSAASLRWVETPCRQTRLGTHHVLMMGLAAIGVGLAAGAVCQSGWRSEPARVQQLADAANDFNPRRKACHASGSRSLVYEQACLWGGLPHEGGREVAVWGDSHGAELAVALGEALGPRGRWVRQLTTSSCPPVPGLWVPRAQLVNAAMRPCSLPCGQTCACRTS